MTPYQLAALVRSDRAARPAPIEIVETNGSKPEEVRAFFGGGVRYVYPGV